MNRVRATDAKTEQPAKEQPSDARLYAQLEDGLLIDKYALDDALIRQPDYIYRISSVVAMRLSQRDAAKQELQECEARADQRLRREAADAEEKITVEQIKQGVKIDKAVVRASGELAELTFQLNRWGALKEAFLARGHAMRDLVSLYSAGYWSDASAGRAKNSRDNEARDAIAAARKRGRD